MKEYIIPQDIKNILVSEHGYSQKHIIIFDRESGDKNSFDSKGVVLEKYFSDIERLFLSRLSKFISSPNYIEEESKWLKNLLDEMIRVKILIVKSSDS